MESILVTASKETQAIPASEKTEASVLRYDTKLVTKRSFLAPHFSTEAIKVVFFSNIILKIY